METNICPVCHQPILPTYYFCPNCGAKVNEPPLSTSAGTQALIYLESIVLPIVLFLFIKKWPGVKYFKSKDPKANRIGQVAWVLLIVSTIFVIWFSYVWTEQAIQSSVDSINTDFNF
ncbi:zinc ribbon domain-containing protein [Candidatus Nomurabacteria bacterium]|nr:zinc ribbon domain-containing protein [Candidatus Nomurabacteria bacterium]